MSLRQKFIATENLPRHLQEIGKTPLALAQAASSSERTAEELTLLGRHENPYVRSSVAGNAKTPAEILIELADDTTTTGMRQEPIFETVAHNDNAPAEALEKVYANKHLMGEFGYAAIDKIYRHPNTPDRLRDQIQLDISPPAL